MKSLLKNYFGYDKFRPMQEEIIRNILQKKDVLVIMSTGGGKSICYQLPALKFEGITLVISPLIALMKDQVDELKLKGIKAEFINSSLSYEEIINIQNKIWKNEVKILYIAPERLSLNSFKEFLKTIEISLIAVDEAHCISEWGHEFRPDYRNLKSLREIFSNVPIIALTATATKKVREDILKQLSLRNPQIFVSSFNRKNLNLIVMKKKNILNKILELLVKHKEDPVIIYCFSRKDSEKIAQNLTNNGFNALPYHAGLDNQIRKRNQELFINNEIKIIVATIAFGMGINKPDIRMIVHCTFPKSVEGYYQEIGRAGRDGILSDCILFYSYGDKRKHEFFINQIKDENVQRIAREKLSQIINYSEINRCRRKYLLEYFGEDFLENNCNGCDLCLKLPEIKGELISKELAIEKIKEDLDYDKCLFEKLRVLRKQIANQKGVSAFIIFSDKSLKEMAYSFPEDDEKFLRINGVGQQKLKDFGELFLEAIKDYVEENNIAPVKIFEKNHRDKARNSLKNYRKTKEMISEKIPIRKIAKMQELKERTIIDHIEKIIDSGKKIDINYLIPQKEKFEIIKSAFEKIGIERLAPIYNCFNGEYSYEEIRLVRVIVKSGMVDNNEKLNIKTDYHKRSEQIKEDFQNAYEPWEEEEGNKLKNLYLENTSIDEIAQILKRQPSAVRSRLKKFGFL